MQWQTPEAITSSCTAAALLLPLPPCTAQTYMCTLQWPPITHMLPTSLATAPARAQVRHSCVSRCCAFVCVYSACMTCSWLIQDTASCCSCHSCRCCRSCCISMPPLHQRLAVYGAACLLQLSQLASYASVTDNIFLHELCVLRSSYICRSLCSSALVKMSRLVGLGLP